MQFSTLLVKKQVAAKMDAEYLRRLKFFIFKVAFLSFLPESKWSIQG
jgi:hypothetical protein